jgi:hypothetical protein
MGDGDDLVDTVQNTHASKEETNVIEIKWISFFNCTLLLYY